METCEGGTLNMKCKPPYIIEIKDASYGVWSNHNSCGASYNGMSKCHNPDSLKVRFLQWLYDIVKV